MVRFEKCATIDKKIYFYIAFYVKGDRTCLSSDKNNTFIKFNKYSMTIVLFFDHSYFHWNRLITLNLYTPQYRHSKPPTNPEFLGAPNYRPSSGNGAGIE